MKKTCKKGFIINPITKKCIKLNGPTYNKLIKEGKIKPGGPIKSLPVEMQFKILSKIPPDQLNNMCKTSKIYRDICKSYKFYKVYSKKWFEGDDLPKRAWFKRGWPTRTLTYVYYKEAEKVPQLRRPKMVRYTVVHRKAKVRGHYYLSNQTHKKAGKVHGLHQSWYSNGRLWLKDNYKNGKKHGLHQTWYENGAKEFKRPYKNGKEHGVSRRWYSNGQKWTETNMKNGKYHGVHKTWYLNGQKEWLWNFKDGKFHGIYKEWDRHGTLDEHKTYKNGKVVKIWIIK